MASKFITILAIGTLIIASSFVTAIPVIPQQAYAATEEWAFVLKWGSVGTGDGQFANNETPADIAIDTSTGAVYVTDYHRVQKFDTSGNFDIKWGSVGSTDGALTHPRGIAVGPDKNVYVADTGNHRIQVFNPNGGIVTKWGTHGSGDGQFDIPIDVTVDSHGNVYVADQNNGRIQKFKLANPCPSGTTEIVAGVCFVTKWGSVGSRDGQFSFLWSVATDSVGNLYVGDDSRIQKFTFAQPCPSDTTQIVSGVCLAKKWGTFGTGDGQMWGPQGVAVDPSDYVYATDPVNHRVQKFNNTGTFITKWGTAGSRDGQFGANAGFEGPKALAFDSSGNAYVADNNNSRIQKFRLASACNAVPSNLVSWLPGDGHPNDIVGSKHGTLAGASFAAGKASDAFSFDGTNDSVELPSMKIANSAGTGISTAGWTVDFWIYPTSSTAYQHLISNDYTSNNFGAFYFYIDHLRWLAGGKTIAVTSQGSVPLNKWSHVTLKVDDRGSNIYLNGVNRVTSASVPYFDNSLKLGYAIKGSDNYFKGLIDEVQIYTRPLSDSEIKSIFDTHGNLCKPLSIITKSQLADSIIGQDSSQQIQALYGKTPHTFSITAGSAPAGMSLSSTGVLSGTATTAGTSAFTVKVEDSNTGIKKETVSKDFSLKVIDCTDQPSGLVSWWKGEDNAKDSKGTNHGTLSSGTSFVTGKVGKAFKFNANDGNDYVDIPTMNIGNSWSIALWVNPTAGTSWHHLVSNTRSSTDYGNLYFVANGISYVQNRVTSTPSGSVPFNSWTHVTVTFDGSDLKTYINGGLPKLTTSYSHLSHTSNFNNPIRLGYAVVASDVGFMGLMDEVQIYNRALSHSEIQSLILATLDGGNCSNSDYDSDGIKNNVDTNPLKFSDDFNDVASGGTTTGTITSRGDQKLAVQEQSAPYGVSIKADSSGGQMVAKVNVCNGAAQFSLNAGDEVIITCGSVILEVVSGTVEVDLLGPNNRLMTISLNEGNGLAYYPDTFSIQASSTNTGILTLNILSGDMQTVVLAPNESTEPDFTIDAIPPVITVPVDTTAEPTSAAGAVVVYEVYATDDVDGPLVSLACRPASGSTFAIGKTLVSCTSSDSAGNAATSTFIVTVQDTIAPSLRLPGDIVVDATSPSGAVVTYVVGATDAVDTDPLVECSPASGSNFEIGIITTVQCLATDDYDNFASSSFAVKVRSVEEMRQNLISLIDNMNLQHGIATSLKAKVNNGDCGAMGAFVNEVDAIQGNKLTTSEAIQLRTAANNILAALSCY